MCVCVYAHGVLEYILLGHRRLQVREGEREGQRGIEKKEREGEREREREREE